MSTTAEKLRRARKLIEDPAHWIKGASEDVIDGRQRYCAVGALATQESWLGEAYEALSTEVPSGWPVYLFNDDEATTHADVLALYDRAIAASEGDR